MNFTNEQINKARQANSAEELLEIANENGVKLTKDEAQNYFNKLNKDGALSDDELLAVSGGKGEPDPKYNIGDTAVITRHVLGKNNSLLATIIDRWYDGIRWIYKVQYDIHGDIVEAEYNEEDIHII